MVKLLFSLVLFILVLFSFSRCGSEGQEKGDQGVPDSVINDSKIPLSDDAINDIIRTFPSPVEMAVLIKDMDVAFSMKYLVSTEVVDEYDTNIKKALGLGVLSADLGYLNIYGKTGQIIDYITVIKRIADDLRVGQFFDFQTLKRLATNNENLDSLMFLSVSSYHQMDEHLRNNNRSNLSALVVTGVWIQGVYLSTQVVKEKYNASIADRIGENKIILDNLLNILKIFKKDPAFQNLVTELEQLQSAYEPVKITYEMGKTEKKVVNGNTEYIQHDKSSVEMTREQLDKIISVTEKVRNKLIAL